MSVEEFKEIANSTLAEYTKERKERYGWTRWVPDRTPPPYPIIVCFNYTATLWEDDESRIFDTLVIDKGLTKEQTITYITNWLDEHLPTDQYV